MRVFVLIACLLATPSTAQTPIERVSPRAAFAGGPIHLTDRAQSRLRTQFHGDNVPLIPPPFRTRLDAALAAGNWKQIETLKKSLIQDRDLLPVLLWDQTRYIATGGIAVAAGYARDLAGSDVPNAEETAATMWLYAVAATFTDGHKCADPAAKEAYLTSLLGSDYDAVKGIIRSMPDVRLAAIRDTAIRLEAALSTDRTDDAICQTIGDQSDLGPTRTMLPQHLKAITSIVRAKEPKRP